MKKEQENKNEWLRRAVAKDAQYDGYDYKSFLNFLQLIHAFEQWTPEECFIRPIDVLELEEIYDELGGITKW